MEPLPIRIEARLREEIGRRGLILLESGRRGKGGTSVIEVIVDSEEGATIDELTDLARWTSALLDEAENDLPGRYRLEVTTPGLDRPLEHLWQYRKSIGRLLKLVYDVEGTLTTGRFRLLDVTDTALLAEPVPEKGQRGSSSASEVKIFPFGSIAQATVEPEI